MDRNKTKSRFSLKPIHFFISGYCLFSIAAIIGVLEEGGIIPATLTAGACLIVYGVAYAMILDFSK